MTTLQISGMLHGQIPVCENRHAEPVTAWLDQHCAQVLAQLTEHGSILLRGFSSAGDDTAENVLGHFSGELLDDAYWSTPRSGVAKKTFTATEYPSPKTIALHSEMAYMNSWPRLLAFHAIATAEQGGETTLCNLDSFSKSIGDLLEQFARLGVLYKRTYHPGVDIPWQKAFQTDDRNAVKKIARRIGMEVHWLREDVLQTTHIAQGVVTTATGEPLWFNQSHIFHVANLPADTLAQLQEIFSADELPRNAYFGDGSPIPNDAIHRINAELTAQTLKVPWQPDDVLVIDNMRFMHGRMPFSGTRKLHVAMAEKYDQKLRAPLAPRERAAPQGGLFGALAGILRRPREQHRNA